MSLKPNLLLALTAGTILAAGPIQAQDRGITYSLFGTPGLIDMPSAMAANDGQIAATLGFFQGQQRNSFTFQITPRLSGTFRYSSVDDYLGVNRGLFLPQF